MKKEIKVLIVEDSQEDFLLILREFKQAGYEILHQRVDTAEELKQALTKQDWDIILSDYSMPNLNGLEALEIVKKAGKDTPFLIVSGSIGEDAAVEILKKGAADYIMKDRIARLVPEV
ncbi:MAG: response regulator, partial [candidate division Zixibacteria bacterium]|nr:response regulator [candidate division Zixibacteria bacterium]